MQTTSDIVVKVLNPFKRHGKIIPEGSVIDMPAALLTRLHDRVEVLSTHAALQYIGVTMDELEDELDMDPDWPILQMDQRRLIDFAMGIKKRKLREAGIAPESYTAVRECQGCGPVFLEPWNPAKVVGCPWCLNRVQDLPIPRPERRAKSA